MRPKTGSGSCGRGGPPAADPTRRTAPDENQRTDTDPAPPARLRCRTPRGAVKRIGELLPDAGAAYRRIDRRQRLSDALAVMREQGVRHLLVVSGGRSVGLLSCREVLEGLLRGDPREPSPVPLDALGLRDPCRAGVDDDLALAARRLEASGASALVATDGERVAGVIPADALALALARTLENELDALNDYLSDLHDAGID